MIDPMQEISDDETESSRHQFVKVELSVSETRPVRSSGSGEEDNEEEPPTFSTVSTPASSIHTYSQSVQSAMNNEQGAGSSGLQQPLVEEQGIINSNYISFASFFCITYKLFLNTYTLI